MHNFYHRYQHQNSEVLFLKQYYGQHSLRAYQKVHEIQVFMGRISCQTIHYLHIWWFKVKWDTIMYLRLGQHVSMCHTPLNHLSKLVVIVILVKS